MLPMTLAFLWPFGEVDTTLTISYGKNLQMKPTENIFDFYVCGL